MIEEGATVKVDFIGKLRNGAEFSNSHLVGEPLQFTIGDGNMLAAFERIVRSMNVGDTVHEVIPCQDAYGPYDESLIERVPVALIPNSQNLQEGAFIVFETPQESIRAKVIKLDGGWVYFDRNHELAGEDLLFDITLVDIVDDQT